MNHSRGGLTITNAMSKIPDQAFVNIGKIYLNGSAANAQDLANKVDKISHGRGVVLQSTHVNDWLVSQLIGGNPPTGGNKNTGMFSAHSFYVKDRFPSQVLMNPWAWENANGASTYERVKPKKD